MSFQGESASKHLMCVCSGEVLWCMLCAVGKCCGVCCVQWGSIVVYAVCSGEVLWCMLCAVGKCCGVCCVQWGSVVVYAVCSGEVLWCMLCAVGKCYGVCCVQWGSVVVYCGVCSAGVRSSNKLSLEDLKALFQVM